MLVGAPRRTGASAEVWHQLLRDALLDTHEEALATDNETVPIPARFAAGTATKRRLSISLISRQAKIAAIEYLKIFIVGNIQCIYNLSSQ